MKDISKEVMLLSEEEVFLQLKEILYEVAPLKIVEEITYQTSLVEDFAFDSIDIMGTLLKIQERFLKDSSMFEVDAFINETFSKERRFTVRMVCQQIVKIMPTEGTKNE
ncbi:MAG: hypothetical protein JSV88_28265 [Candidatus Aminicenantes bacterium]|nr:MAG: hypothetical protein JSV88_28265 [Candidatus Aminicenantes bacterium]